MPPGMRRDRGVRKPTFLVFAALLIGLGLTLLASAYHRGSGTGHGLGEIAREGDTDGRLEEAYVAILGYAVGSFWETAAGDWNFIGIKAGSGMPRYKIAFLGIGDETPGGASPNDMITTASIIPGVHTYWFRLGADGEELDIAIRLAGIAPDEPFRIRGPCVLEAGVGHELPLVLTGDTVNYEAIGGNITVSPSVNAFLDAGLAYLTFPGQSAYDVAVTWRMPAPPAGGTEMEISHATKRVFAYDPANVTPATYTALANAGLCTAAGGRLPELNSIKFFSDTRAGGGVFCDGEGGFEPAFSHHNTLKFTSTNDVELTGELSVNEMRSLVRTLEDCTLVHEGAHVRYYHTHPNISGVCRNLCCYQAAPLPRGAICRDYERDGDINGIACLDRSMENFRRQALTSFNPVGAAGMEFLEGVKAAWDARIWEPIRYENCN